MVAPSWPKMGRGATSSVDALRARVGFFVGGGGFLLLVGDGNLGALVGGGSLSLKFWGADWGGGCLVGAGDDSSWA